MVDFDPREFLDKFLGKEKVIEQINDMFDRYTKHPEVLLRIYMTEEVSVIRRLIALCAIEEI